ncbi:MAG: primosomal protein N' [Acidobacteriota bacterium]
MGCLASVAVPVPTLGVLTYRVPDELGVPRVGCRVLVPLGTRTLTGCVVAVETAADDDARFGGANLRDVIDLLDAEAFLPPAVVRLTLWVADYYACGPGEAIGAAVPPMAWIESRRVVTLTDAGRDRLEAGPDAGGSAMAHAALKCLAGSLGLPASSLRTKLASQFGKGSKVPINALVRTLERAGLISATQVLEGERQAYKTTRVVQATPEGVAVAHALQAGGAVNGLGARQQEALRMLAATPDGMPSSALAEHQMAADGLRRLAARGLVTVHRVPVERDPFEGPWGRHHAPDGPDPRTRQLTGEQASALERLTALCAPPSFRVALLHGVTGSGKTELYLRLAESVLMAKRRSLVLVPEIALTPAVALAFRQRFGDRVAIQHSGLSDGERHDQWQRIRRDEIDVVVGTRSAVFAPLSAVGLIVVDEEHDGSYKQQDSPRYNGRDLAIVRGQQEGALVVLGSATPSMESFQHASRGRYELIPLERRVLDRPLAAVRTVNMRDEFAEVGPGVILSRALTEAIAGRLTRKEQVLLLLNRRGFSTAVFCRQCGGTVECPNCSVALVVHGRSGAACHYCNHSTRVPRACPACGGTFLEQVGFGTERVEAEVRAAFPAARVARLDRDSVRHRGAVPDLLNQFGSGQIDVLVGTQMIAKGHDFPRVTLVGVISADVGLGLADFRASERTFQLLTQVVGRAGRGELSGDAIIQTIYPDHYSIRHACRQDYGAFFKEELQFRRAMRYPPMVALINAVVRGPSSTRALSDAADLAKRVVEAAAPGAAFVVLGPAPAPLSRLKGEHRAQFFVKGTPATRKAMREAVKAALDARPDLRRKTSIDVDPLSVM